MTILYALVVRERTSWRRRANLREAASAASRASALSSQACAAARSAGASVFNSRRASAKSLRSAAAVTRATMAPRSLPTASVRSMRTSFAAPACRRSTMPVPVVAASGAAATVSARCRASRGSARRRRHAGGRKGVQRLQRIGIGRERLRRRELRRIGIAVAHRDVEQRRRHDTAQRLVVRRLGVGDLLALLRELGALRLAGALELREALVEGGEIGGRRQSRGADFASLTAQASFSACARAASSLRSAATDFSSASMPRAPMAGSAAGLLALASTPATRPLSASTVAPVDLRRGRRRLHGGPAQRPADRDHECGCHGAGKRRDHPGRNRRGMQRGLRSQARRRPARRRRTFRTLRTAGLLGAACPAAGLRLGRRPAAGSRLRLPRGRWWAGCAWHGRTRGANPASSGLSSAIVTVPHTYMP